MDDCFAFLQCQLRMEAAVEGCSDVSLPPTGASIWRKVSMWSTPNIPSGKWVPYHTALASGERFLLQRVHCKESWDAWQRWVAMLVFRGHGRPELFTEVQLPLMMTEQFWRSPINAFKPEGTWKQPWSLTGNEDTHTHTHTAAMWNISADSTAHHGRRRLEFGAQHCAPHPTTPCHYRRDVPRHVEG